MKPDKMHVINARSFFLFISILLLALFSSCKNNLIEDNENEVIFPNSLVIERILSTTWKTDQTSIKLIFPEKEGVDTDKKIRIASGKLLNSIKLEKNGTVYISYVYRYMGNVIFHNKGKWIISAEDPNKLVLRIDSPYGILDLSFKVRKLALFQNQMILEAYLSNTDFAFTVTFSGKSSEEDYWNKETEAIDPSWYERNKVSTEPIMYHDIVGSYSADNENWKRVVQIDNLADNLYPLLFKHKIVFQSNGNVLLQRLEYGLFGATFYTGNWRIEQNKILLDFPLFPFCGNKKKYAGVAEIEKNPLSEDIFCARPNANLVIEIIQKEENRLLVKISELGVCSFYLYLNKI